MCPTAISALLVVLALLTFTWKVTVEVSAWFIGLGLMLEVAVISGVIGVMT
jgi:hypothetical protein